MLDSSDEAQAKAAFDFLTKGRIWGEPVPLPSGLAPVPPFNRFFLPNSVAPWVEDVADRMQCPPDFVAVPVITALGSLIGRKVGIRPQQYTDWTEVPNIWGCIVGRPGMLKSPSMDEALRPLKRLEAEAHKDFATKWAEYELAMDRHKLKRSLDLKAASKAGKPEMLDRGDEPIEPRPKRYATNDSSYEKLGEILADNPNGVLVVRDELISLLKHLDLEEKAVARGFFLSGWSGTQGYTFDRIGRGTVRLEAICLGVLGLTTPGTLSEYVRRATAGGAGDDGMIQRFGLLVWPDHSGDWKNVDRGLNVNARDTAYKVFTGLNDLSPTSTGQVDKFGGINYVRFDEEAAEIFLDWRGKLETQISSPSQTPALASHFAKYRKLVPALALINHLADGGTGDTVGRLATDRAVRFSYYLAKHARRIYRAGREGDVTAAAAILSRIRRKDLNPGFTARDIHQKDWAHLTDRQQVGRALTMLEDHSFIASQTVNHAGGGRPTTSYLINPVALEK
jgi:putative DNA primase/helicase